MRARCTCQAVRVSWSRPSFLGWTLDAPGVQGDPPGQCPGMGVNQPATEWRLRTRKPRSRREVKRFQENFFWARQTVRGGARGHFDRGLRWPLPLNQHAGVHVGRSTVPSAHATLRRLHQHEIGEAVPECWPRRLIRATIRVGRETELGIPVRNIWGTGRHPGPCLSGPLGVSGSELGGSH